ncbi:MAG TPA: metal-dependent phosphohydrolase, partial [Planctomycetaceae bacterium]|nr:metal-dependent phosphohydrolase [Planctomycetaceae bacterium]
NWQCFLRRDIPWMLAGETTALFASDGREQVSIFSHESTFEAAVRANLPEEFKSIAMHVDIARHLHRPGAVLPSAGRNFLYDPQTGKVGPLEEEELFQHIPQSFRICRVYVAEPEHREAVAT